MEAKSCLVTERRAGWQNKGWTDQDHLGDSCLFFQSCCNGPSWKSRWTPINQPVRTCSMLTLCSPLMSLWAICSQWPESWRLGPQLGNKAMGAWLSVTAEGTLKRSGCRAPAPPALLGQEPQSWLLPAMFEEWVWLRAAELEGNCLSQDEQLADKPRRSLREKRKPMHWILKTAISYTNVLSERE